MFINPQDTKKMAMALSEILDSIIPESQYAELELWKKKRLTSLRYQWTLGNDVIKEMKDLLKIRPYLDKKEAYLKIKFN